jgi:hypothetical protein
MTYDRELVTFVENEAVHEVGAAVFDGRRVRQIAAVAHGES